MQNEIELCPSADGDIKGVKDNLNKVLANMPSTKKKDMSEAVVQLTKKNPEKTAAIAGGTVAVVGAGIGVAVHNKNNKDQSTQQPAAQPQGKQSDWKGFLYTSSFVQPRCPMDMFVCGGVVPCV